MAIFPGVEQVDPEHITDDCAEPISPQTALQARYIVGLDGGNSCVNAGPPQFALANEVMVELSLKYWANYKQHTSGVNKLEFLYIADSTSEPNDGVPRVFLSGFGDEIDDVNNPMIPGFGLQGIVGIDGVPVVAVNLRANFVPGDRLTLGAWHHLCYQAGMNSDGEYDGHLKLWRELDGVWTKIGEWTTIQFAPASAKALQVLWSPMRGGGGDENTVESTIRLGHHRHWTR